MLWGEACLHGWARQASWIKTCKPTMLILYLVTTKRLLHAAICSHAVLMVYTNLCSGHVVRVLGRGNTCEYMINIGIYTLQGNSDSGSPMN